MSWIAYMVGFHRLALKPGFRRRMWWLHFTSAMIHAVLAALALALINLGFTAWLWPIALLFIGLAWSDSRMVVGMDLLEQEDRHHGR